MPLKLVRNDIIHMDVDAIVNTANPMPVIGRGTDSGIYQAAGIDKLLEARRQIGEMKAGQVALTPGFDLKARHIIHAVGSRYIDGTQGEADILKACYRNSLELAKEHGFESVAFPLIATGSYRYPKREALEIAVSVISNFLLENDMTVYLVVFDEEAFTLSGKLFDDIDAYIDQKYVEEKSFKERFMTLVTSFERGGRYDSEIEYDLFEDDYEDACEGTYEEAELDRLPVFAAPAMPAGSASKKSLEDVMSHVEEDFRVRLFRLIDERGLTDTQVYKKANLDRKLFSKIRCKENYQPKKNTAIALALALELNLDETRDLLSRAGYALSPGSKFDLIIQYFIENQIYDIQTINYVLFDYELPCLGD